MNTHDKKAFAISALILIGVTVLAIDEGGEMFVLLLPVGLYWLYRYLNKDISFLNQKK